MEKMRSVTKHTPQVPVAPCPHLSGLPSTSFCCRVPAPPAEATGVPAWILPARDGTGSGCRAGGVTEEMSASCPTEPSVQDTGQARAATANTRLDLDPKEGAEGVGEEGHLCEEVTVQLRPEPA